MAKNKKDETRLNYREELNKLKEIGPERLYLLWGPEDYLREQYLQQLKSLCLPEGEDSFSFKRMEGPELDLTELQIAIDAIPFLTQRSLIELREIDINRAKEPDRLLEILRDIPDYCTVVFTNNPGFSPDGRLKHVKALRELAHEIKFTQQSDDMLVNWIQRRFRAAGKHISPQAAQRLVFVSGDLMNGLIPEIDKLSAYAKTEEISVEDIDKVAHHLPEAIAFEMTDRIAKREFDKAMQVLDELLADKANEPIAILAAIGGQMRRLYAARLVSDAKRGVSELMDVMQIRQDFIASQLINAARRFSLAQLKRAVTLCAETDYQMKSSGGDAKELLKELLLRIMAGQTDDVGS